MKKILVMALTLYFGNTTLFASIKWSSPPVLCPEEILPKGLTCLDLSQVKNPYTDFPIEMSSEEISNWKNNNAIDLQVCRRQEILNREKIKPGSFSSAKLEEAWMVADSANNINEKLDAIQEASVKYGIPPQVLVGALKQESLLSSLGLSPDGGNYSCGISQLNIQEWCQSMNQLSLDEKEKYGWPSIKCDSDNLPTNIVKSFYDIAVKKLDNRLTYQLRAEDFKNITPEQVDMNFPPADSTLQDKRFKAILSFTTYCQDPKLSILFKAQNLKSLYDRFVPAKLKNNELYSDKNKFQRNCKQPYSTRAYPLQTGWLLAVAMYNAGPLEAKLVKYYFKVENNNYPNLNPLDLIEALYWGGKYKPDTNNRIFFNDPNGKQYSQNWYKSCVVQRHIARVIQYVTVPKATIATSLEQSPCSFDTIPEYRKNSSGIKAK